MRGSVVQKPKGSGKWYVVLYHGKGPDGKKKQTWHPGGQSKAEAERERIRLLHELNTGVYVEPSRTTLAEYLEQWLRHISPSVRPKTQAFYAEAIHKYLIPALGQHRLVTLQPLHIQGYYSEALVSGRRRGKGGLSARTVYHHHRVLSQALQQAVRWQLLPRNPASLVDPPRAEKSEMRFLSEEETARLLRVARESSIYVPVLVAVSTGIRRGEVLGLRWSDLNFGSGSLTVNQSLENTPEGPRFRPPKSSRSRRTITLSKSVTEVLRRHREEQRQQKDEAAGNYRDHDLVCALPDGSPFSPAAFSKRFELLTKKATLTRLRFHDLRHTHVAHLINEGVHVKVISERLGHTSIATTMNVYGHLLPQLDQQAAERMERLFGGIIGEAPHQVPGRPQDG